MDGRGKSVIGRFGGTAGRPETKTLTSGFSVPENYLTCDCLLRANLFQRVRHTPAVLRVPLPSTMLESDQVRLPRGLGFIPGSRGLFLIEDLFAGFGTGGAA